MTSLSLAARRRDQHETGARYDPVRAAGVVRGGRGKALDERDVRLTISFELYGAATA